MFEPYLGKIPPGRPAGPARGYDDIMLTRLLLLLFFLHTRQTLSIISPPFFYR